jgi:sugar phosphate isomerase/epimerase
METMLAVEHDVPLEVGIFAKTFQRDSVDGVFDAIANHGLTCTQWNWACVPGLPSLPDSVTPETTRRVARAALNSGVRIVAVSMTFNLIQAETRRRALARLPELADAALAIGCDLLTLCTGTRHPTDMWAYHPGNESPGAWAEMIDGLREASHMASRSGVRLAIEPETANVVAGAVKAQRALAELGPDGDRIRIVLDAANLYRPPVDPRRYLDVIDDALVRLAPFLGLAHAKDIAEPGAVGVTGTEASPEHYTHIAAGTGILPYPHYLDALVRAVPRVSDGNKLPLVLHGLSEAQVGDSVRFLRRAIGDLRVAAD